MHVCVCIVQVLYIHVYIYCVCVCACVCACVCVCVMSGYILGTWCGVGSTPYFEKGGDAIILISKTRYLFTDTAYDSFIACSNICIQVYTS